MSPPRGARYWLVGWWTVLVRRDSGCPYCGSAYPHREKFCDMALWQARL